MIGLLTTYSNHGQDFFATGRLSAKLWHSKYSGVSFQKVNRFKPDFNFVAFYPEYVPDQYYQLNISGEVGKDDFALYNRMHLVVSEKVLILLRDNHVTHAEADEIQIPFDEYFNSNKKNFWMELERKRMEEQGLLPKKV